VFDIDTSKTVDYVDLIPVDSNVTLKVTGFEVGYTSVIDPADNPLDFSLTGVDADGDAATADFTVTVLAGTDGNDTITTGSGDDSVSGGLGNDVISSNGGDDILSGGPGDDTLDGGAGTDLLDWSDATGAITHTIGDGGSGSATIAGLGTDTYTNMEGIIGGSFGDQLTGNSANNVLIGGGGSDTLTGGGSISDSDSFVFKFDDLNSGADTITDFTLGAGGDKLNIADLLSGAGITPQNFVADPSAYLTVSPGGDTTVSFDADGAGGNAAVQIATLQGVNTDLTTLLTNDQIVTE
jgi:Ca2+-binding RTX toxin-like protein